MIHRNFPDSDRQSTFNLGGGLILNPKGIESFSPRLRRTSCALGHKRNSHLSGRWIRESVGGKPVNQSRKSLILIIEIACLANLFIIESQV